MSSENIKHLMLNMDMLFQSLNGWDNFAAIS